ncbi:MGMT family protein [Thaumasiovibrio subtropicus]|uniref:MGMT family protein n=1 Tax=Thaumasiovibrio subtropicus TaxID=1891207 RepID=UPI000B34F1A6|nr:MGMT family protein [Thaumasiovibrio subtropicus]
MNEFEQQIYAAVYQIPSGSVATYGDIAKLAGYPGYARHVGKVLSSLPKDTQLPWFRIINSQGRISLKGTSLERQMARLREEGILVEPNGKISLKKYRWRELIDLN